MNVKGLGRHLENNAEFNQNPQRNFGTIFLVVFASFTLGAIPIIYGSRLTPESSQHSVNVPGETTLWKALGQR
ncbi:hypothetical protein NIES267_67210 [Calothrix parasitica NIES-267]|uniref:Uncharacterized protein n=1 Tax=Calothrix parasitica NIES-267 TaxID=1973488 RepID=A0A1Z4M148_9CYAN|nr:hypothetical protein NIES267_67210 [Calothrix parasitica NIES-267]